LVEITKYDDTTLTKIQQKVNLAKKKQLI